MSRSFRNCMTTRPITLQFKHPKVAPNSRTIDSHRCYQHVIYPIGDTTLGQNQDVEKPVWSETLKI